MAKVSRKRKACVIQHNIRQPPPSNARLRLGLGRLQTDSAVIAASRLACGWYKVGVDSRQPRWVDVFDEVQSH
eukprot:4549238-Amphidinium_carterae.2